jgi:hypothetical protein
MRHMLLKTPADLRDPLLLASRTDDELARAILQGGLFVGRTKWMPGFATELSEQDVLDLVALLRGDSIYLVECFPDADLYATLELEAPGPPVLAAYDTTEIQGTPRVLPDADSIPPNARPLGYVMFAELELGKGGPTPVALVADLRGDVTGIRVALPEPDNRRAQQDLEDTVIRKIPRVPRLLPVLRAGEERLGMAAGRDRRGDVPN